MEDDEITMTVLTPPITVEEFDRLALLPENAQRNLEFINGRIVEVVSNDYSSGIAAFLTAKLLIFVHEKGLGKITTTDGGYQIGRERYIPDVAFISKARKPAWTFEAYTSVPPELVVEVLSPSNTPDAMRIKITNYLSVGTVVWVVDPDKQRVEVHSPGEFVQVFELNDTLDGGKVLPGFQLPVKDIFSI
jgi:Uma2 family endonuclease